jgi:hypothetical protein
MNYETIYKKPSSQEMHENKLKKTKIKEKPKSKSKSKPNTNTNNTNTNTNNNYEGDVYPRSNKVIQMHTNPLRRLTTKNDDDNTYITLNKTVRNRSEIDDNKNTSIEGIKLSIMPSVSPENPKNNSNTKKRSFFKRLKRSFLKPKIKEEGGNQKRKTKKLKNKKNKSRRK